MDKLIRYTVKCGKSFDHYYHSGTFKTKETTHEEILKIIDGEIDHTENPQIVSYEIVEKIWKC